MTFPPVVKGFGLLGDVVPNRLSALLKREVVRRIPQEILAELSRLKFEIIVWEGTPYESTKIIDPFDPMSPDVKVLSYVKSVDHTSVGGRKQTDIVAFGIEDLTVPDLADDWKDLIVTARLWWNADGTAPESILISVDGQYTHAIVYEDGVKVYESTWDEAAGMWHTRYLKSVPYPTTPS